MSFSSRFLAHFSEQERKSELVKLIAQQGDIADLAISQEWTKRVLSSTEFILFPESQLRSWLAFLLLDVPNYVSAEGVMVVTSVSGGAVSVPAGTGVSTSTGQPYITLTDLYLPAGQTGQVAIRQGESSTSSGTYSDFIKISSPNCDLANIQVIIAGVSLRRCRIISSYVTPYDGFHSYFYDGNLFIKVYPGPNTPAPNGQPYTVVTWESQGKDGNLPTNAITGFADTVTDLAGLEVELEFSNNEITNGSNSPSRADLVWLLRQWFFVKTTVSSIPEYTIWFMNQPEVGAVIVEGDFERYMRSLDGDLPITGKVYVAGLDPMGRPLSQGSQQNLLVRIQDVKDIGVIEWQSPVEVKCYLEVSFFSSTSDSAFTSFVSSTIENYFSLEWLADNDSSPFDDLDLESVRRTIGFSYAQSGMVITPYHYYEDLSVSGTDWYLPETAIYSGESGVGHYLAYRKDKDDPSKWESKPYARFEQYIDPDSDGSVIYCVADDTDQFPKLPAYVGFRSASGTLEMSGYAFETDTKMEAYWEIENPGILPIGVTYGFRSLAGYKVVQAV